MSKEDFLVEQLTTRTKQWMRLEDEKESLKQWLEKERERCKCVGWARRGYCDDCKDTCILKQAFKDYEKVLTMIKALEKEETKTKPERQESIAPPKFSEAEKLELFRTAHKIAEDILEVSRLRRDNKKLEEELEKYKEHTNWQYSKMKDMSGVGKQLYKNYHTLFFLKTWIKRQLMLTKQAYGRLLHVMGNCIECKQERYERGVSCRRHTIKINKVLESKRQYKEILSKINELEKASASY